MRRGGRGRGPCGWGRRWQQQNNQQQTEAKPQQETREETERYTVTVNRRPMGFRYDGATVTHVFPWGAASRAGMTAGSTIVMVNSQSGDPDVLTTLYQSANLPFEMELTRTTQVPVPKKEQKAAKLEKKIQKTEQKIQKQENKTQQQAQKLGKQEAKINQQRENLMKRMEKVEKGKPSAKKDAKVGKIQAKLANVDQKAENLEKRKENHTKRVNRLEKQKAKMEAKLAKMKQRLEKAAEAQAEQAPIQSDSESSDDETPATAPVAAEPKLRPLNEDPPADEPKPAELVFAVAVDHPYYEQNRMLVNMGFVDERNNMNVLASCDGNLQRAITTLVENANNL